MTVTTMNIEKMKIQMCVKCRNMFQIGNGECSHCGGKEFETHWTSTEDDGDYLFRLVSHVGSEEVEMNTEEEYETPY